MSEELHDCPACKGTGKGEAGDCRLCEGKGKAAAGTLFLDPFVHWFCGLHGQPFRKAWPRGMAPVVIMVIDEVLRDPELWATADEIVAARPELAKPFEGVREALSDVPACCRVGADRMLQLYREAELGRYRRCKVCRREGVGCPMYSKDPNTLKVTKLPHVCFRCVVYKARDLRDS